MNWKNAAIILATVAVACIGVWSYQRNTAAARGRQAYERLGCGGCHTTGAGPNLTHITSRQDERLLEKFIASPPAVYRDRGMRSLTEGYMLMPDMHASPEDARNIVAYLRELNRQDK